MGRKIRMNALDVRAACEELRRNVIGLRLANVYDISPRMYLLKFAQGDVKRHVLIELGIRMHLTQLKREKPSVPSQFVMRLRKGIRSWRCTGIEQLGGDRVVSLSFGSDESTARRLVVEMYDKGNVILLSADGTIGAILRTHHDAARGVHHAGGRPYIPPPLHGANRIDNPLAALPPDAPAEARGQAVRALLGGLLADAPAETVRVVLARIGTMGTQVAEHAMRLADVPPEARVGEVDREVCIDALTEPLVEVLFTLSRTLPEGAFLFFDEKTDAGTGGEPPTPIDISPIMLKQYAGLRTQRVASMGEATDAYFLNGEAQRIESHNDQQRTAVVSKKEKFEQDHRRRIAALENEADRNYRRGELLSIQSEEVDAAILLVRGILAQGLPWEEVWRVIRLRRDEGHPLANMIHELHLDRGTVTLLVEECVDDGSDGEAPCVPIEVDININAHSNAQAYYLKRRAANQRLQKTVDATDRARKGVESKGIKIVKAAGPPRRTIVTERQPLICEKFCWFPTSTMHIVLSGYDDVQNQLLIRRYLSAGDVVVGTDAEGSRLFLIKGRDEGSIPLTAITQAGCMCVCRSRCWESKTPMSAWWVLASQIYIPGDGPAVVRGTKNYLPAMPLQLACGLLFRVERRVGFPPPGEDGPAIASDGGAPTFERQTSEEFPPMRQESAVSAAPSDSPPDSATPGSATNRRLKAKLKRIQQKYKDQDDEDREAAMKLLGNPLSRAHALLPGGSDDDAAVQRRGSAPTPAATPHSSPHAPALRPRGEADAEAAAKLRAEGEAMVPFLTPSPDERDVVVDCVFVCLPMSAARNFLCRAEVSPGHERRGAIAKTALSFFESLMNDKGGHAQLEQFKRCVNEEGASAQLVGNARIRLPPIAVMNPRVKAAISRHRDPDAAAVAMA